MLTLSLSPGNHCHDNLLVFYLNTNVFCYTPQQIIDKYTEDMDPGYTDFANNHAQTLTT